MRGDWQVDGTWLPDGQPRTAWVTRGRLVDAPVDGAELLPGRFVLGGLVDAHCHLSTRRTDAGPEPDDEAGARRRLTRAWVEGVSVVRDTGGVQGITLRLAAETPGRLQASGRFLAPRGQYFPALHEPVEQDDLVRAALAEIAGGARWVKLVGDFPRLDLEHQPTEPTYDVEAVRRLVEAVHAAGARVAAHTGTVRVSELVAAGVDSVEHGPGLTEDDLATMAARGAAWTPTLGAMLDPRAEDSDVRRLRVAGTVERLKALLPAARRLGVPVLTGSDVVGSVPGEVGWLVRLGLDPVDALAAATTTARAFLGVPGALEGGPADLVTYDDDPRDDPAVLARPAAVLHDGRRLA